MSISTAAPSRGEREFLAKLLAEVPDSMVYAHEDRRGETGPGDVPGAWHRDRARRPA